MFREIQAIIKNIMQNEVKVSRLIFNFKLSSNEILSIIRISNKITSKVQQSNKN